MRIIMIDLNLNCLIASIAANGIANKHDSNIAENETCKESSIIP